jgi:hypothetical protein
MSEGLPNLTVLTISWCPISCVRTSWFVPESPGEKYRCLAVPGTVPNGWNRIKKFCRETPLPTAAEIKSGPDGIQTPMPGGCGKVEKHIGKKAPV